MRPNIGQALVIGLISAAVIRSPPPRRSSILPPRASPPCSLASLSTPAGKDGQVKPAVAIVATFVTTFVSGVIFMVIKMAMLGVVSELARYAARRRYDRRL
ncbi:MAG: hypothetical protein ACLU37_10255 [Collinsella sp.]